MTGRARSAEAKDERRQALKDAARATLDAGTPLADATMAGIVARTGLAKGTAYLYYPTKEALFLDVLTDELAPWFATLAGPPTTAEAFAAELADSLLARPRVLTLLALLHVVLEQNLDAASARAFKGFLGEALRRGDAALVARLPGLLPGEGARLLVRAHALVVGLAGMSRPSPVVAAVLEEPELQWLRVDFRAELVGAIAAMVRGAR